MTSQILSKIQETTGALRAAVRDEDYSQMEARLLFLVAELLIEQSGYLPAVGEILSIIAKAQNCAITVKEYKAALRNLDLVCDL